ncbi:PspC domain-containing protein [Pseudactinotalea sp. Z1748]|uniref:PspC domain-containing protein n=1 Tax=Pseudactinotalea sp. Z1748 TaxID=3413027 RepID=UPI003C7DAA13
MDSFFDVIGNLGFRRGPRRVLAGLAGGIADATNLDVVLVRVLLIVAMLLPVLGPTLYIVLWILLPWQKAPSRCSGW